MFLSPAILFGGVVFLAIISGTIAGFGGGVITLSLGAHLMPLPRVIAIMVPIFAVYTLGIVVPNRRVVDTRLLRRLVFPFMGAGMVAGVALSRVISSVLLKDLFAAMVIVLSGRELWVTVRARDGEGPAPLPPIVARLALVGAGVIHGIYACGGPLLVYTVGRLDLGKAAFRATLATVWLVLNSVLTVYFVVAGRATADTLGVSASLFPVVIAGLLIGEWAHRRIPERPFRILVFSLLLASAFALLL